MAEAITQNSKLKTPSPMSSLLTPHPSTPPAPFAIVPLMNSIGVWC